MNLRHTQKLCDLQCKLCVTRNWLPLQSILSYHSNISKKWEVVQIRKSLVHIAIFPYVCLRNRCSRSINPSDGHCPSDFDCLWRQHEAAISLATHCGFKRLVRSITTQHSTQANCMAMTSNLFCHPSAKNGWKHTLNNLSIFAFTSGSRAVPFQ